ncbi:hypothetical protein GCM10010176_018910 [Nonomuraea spiralis]|nr:hypothetical protein GCM10010176_018910 [Nonomuraea spiralis]
MGRALPRIALDQGITVSRDVPVSDGRRGMAFGLADSGLWDSLALEPRTLR